MGTKVKISNQRLWDLAQTGEDVDTWLRDKMKHGTWREWIPFMMVPCRIFEFDNEKDATMFMLRWV